MEKEDLKKFLNETLDKQGFVGTEKEKEEKVEEMMNMTLKSIDSMVTEAVKDADAKDAGNDIFEEALPGDLFIATEDTVLGGVEVEEGDFVEMVDIDDESVIVNIYDRDAEIKEEDVVVDGEEFDEFLADYSDEIEYDEDGDEEEEVEEAHVSFRGGKKHKISDRVWALRKKLKGTKFYVGADGKKHRKSRAQIKAQLKAAKHMKRISKFAHKGMANRLRAKSRKINSSVESGTVAEAFTIHSNGAYIHCYEGDVISISNESLSLVREGKAIIEGLKADEGFFDRAMESGCVKETTIEDKEEKEAKKDKVAESEGCADKAEKAEKKEAKEEKPVKESVLTYEPDGRKYVYTCEGVETPLGNRFRARTWLSRQNIGVTSEQLEDAFNGKSVTLTVQG